MLKLFLRLYLILALSLALFFTATALLPERMLKETLADYIQRLAQGTNSLVVQRLERLPQAQWPEAVERLSERFGYPLTLETPQQAELKQDDRARLARGLATFVRRDGAQVWYLPLPDSNYLLAVQMDRTHAEHGRRMTIGTFRLIEEELQGLPESRWRQRIDQLAKRFWFPLLLLPLEQPGLTPGQRSRLIAGDVVSFGVGTNDDWFLHRVGQSPWILKLGPMTDPWVLRWFNYMGYSALALLVAAVVWLWVQPLWAGVVELRRVTGAFGRGELEARARIPTRSALRVLGDTFNQMAGRIQGLILSHRELTDAVSHELRTPISRLRFGLEMLEQTGSPADRQRYLAGMQEDVSELEELVAELLGYARYERGRQELQPEELELGPWLQRLCRRAAQPDGPQLHCDADPDGQLRVRVDPRLFGRAVSNLLVNARKYAGERVEVRAGAEGDLLFICVEDDGPGVPAAERERIFEPFSRLDRSRDRTSGGYGLGLAIVRRVAELHRGEVTLDESPLGGARFCLHWPKNPGLADAGEKS